MRKQVLEVLAKARLVAIVRLDDLSQAVEISRALLAGGIVIQEYTLTNPAALQVVSNLLATIPEFSSGQAALGVGSVRSPAEAQASIEAGSQFVVSPFLNAKVVECCRQADVACMPGVMTPTEMASAWELGADILKIFPARSLGPDYIKDVLAPMPYLKLMPTGGIDLTNMAAYFKSGASAVGVGGNLIDKQAVASGDWTRVTQVAAKYAQVARATS